MCAIIGCITSAGHDPESVQKTLQTIFARSTERGRDGWGYEINQEGAIRSGHHNSMFYFGYDDTFFDTNPPPRLATLIGNLRAEPTTEYVREKQEHDQQPYRVGKWTIVHNGTIANDEELRIHKHPTSIDSAAIAELLAGLTYWDCFEENSLQTLEGTFLNAIGMLKGSYAILATHDDVPGVIFAACNYRPIWWATDASGVYFASSRGYFPDQMRPIMLPPYSAWRFDASEGTGLGAELARPPSQQRALVVCSGGLDSVVAATKMVRDGYDVSLLHFRYGSRAEGPEDKAIWAVAEALGVGVWTRDMYIWEDTDSPLLQADSRIAGGEEGAEFAHEWVPARNLMMLSHATAMAEAKGFDLLVLGNNLEEAGAYPDNEPEFIQRFNDMLPFAIGAGKKLRVVMPVGNLMKHEIVALGLALNAPLHLTWSCYRAGEQHCGTCGPCFMRRTAFKINNAPEVISYKDS